MNEDKVKNLEEQLAIKEKEMEELAAEIEAVRSEESEAALAKIVEELKQAELKKVDLINKKTQLETELQPKLELLNSIEDELQQIEKKIVELDRS